jgi:hypothetical protein
MQENDKDKFLQFPGPGFSEETNDADKTEKGQIIEFPETHHSPANFPRNLDLILREIISLSSLDTMPYRIELCRHALTMVYRRRTPQLWATLQGELGNSL